MPHTMIASIEIVTCKELTRSQQYEAARLFAGKGAPTAIRYLSKLGADPSVTDYWVNNNNADNDD